MKNIAVICELNPMHKGHEYLFSRIRQENLECRIICLMSGNFVQRGDMAIANKYLRARIAMTANVDLVLELPLPFSILNAEGFAYGAISILKQLGKIDAIYFGSESGDLEFLKECAKILSSDDVKNQIFEKLKLDRTLTYANAVGSILESKEVAQLGANDVLAVEYLKAMIQLKADFEPFAVKRIGGEHDGEIICGEFASAFQIRQMIEMGLFAKCQELLNSSEINILSEAIEKQEVPIGIRNAEASFLGDLRNGIHSDSSFSRFVARQARECTSREELYSKLKSKHYTLASIRRKVLGLYLGMEYGSDYPTPDYTSVLALNLQGRTYLQEIRKLSQIQVITKPGKLSEFAKSSFLARSNIEADKKMTLFYPKIKTESSAFQISPYYKEEG